jgi:hypothetical protein
VQHCTPETLALAALREPLADVDATHLAECAACRAEVASLKRSVDALAVPEFAASVAPVAPPPAVWAAISAATGVAATPRPEQVGQAPAEAAPDAPAQTPGVVRELRPRRSRMLLAMAASLLVGAGIGAGAVALANRDPAQEIAAADLAPLDDRDATGNAEVVATGDGEQLRVVLRAPEPDDGFYEVWLLEPTVQRMVQVGVVRAGTTTLDLPAGIDLEEYPIVDVSVEPLDGDPTHSGVSVARGELES